MPRHATEPVWWRAGPAESNGASRHGDERTAEGAGAPRQGRSSGAGGTLCFAIALPGRKSGFRAGFRPDSNRETSKSARPAGEPILNVSQLESGRNPARTPDVRPGSTIAQHRVGPGRSATRRLERSPPGPECHRHGADVESWHNPSETNLDRAKGRAPNALRIRPEIFDLEPDFGLKRNQTKPEISGTVSTNRHTTIPNDAGRLRHVSTTIRNFWNCELAQPRQGQDGPV